jgi:hypothetical protein
MPTILEKLLSSSEPSIRYKAMVGVLGRRPESAEVSALREEIRDSPRVRGLLGEREADGRIPGHPYAKWRGAHWVLATLADLGYPPGDEALAPMRDQVIAWLLGPDHQKNIRQIDGRTRRCASQESNALYASLALGIAEPRTDELARRLVAWQWPDGGWNCDRHPEAHHSSYHESLIPLRALALHGRLTGSRASAEAAERAAELFLKRCLFRRLSDGRPMDPDFTRLYYPTYWHYTVLGGLKVMAEAGFIGDPRCAEGLDLLESKRLPDGGWPAEKAAYRVTDKRVSGRSAVAWGGVSVRRMNEWVTVEALTVLAAAGRLTSHP